MGRGLKQLEELLSRQSRLGQNLHERVGAISSCLGTTVNFPSEFSRMMWLPLCLTG